MPTINRTTSGMFAVNVSSIQSRINALRAKMATAAKVTAADYNELVSIYNTWVLHRHTSTDLRGIDTFGNLTVYGGGTYATTPVSNFPSGKSSSGLSVAIDDDLTATDVNNLITIINNIRSHTHSIFDTTS